MPPTESTLGDAEGYSVVPESPEAATNVTPLCPCRRGENVVVRRSHRQTRSVPQLMETTDTPGRLLAKLTALNKSFSVGCASTSTMFAAGAIACAHSTSSAVSSAQPELTWL